MLKDYHSNQGHELAVTWLFALYKQQTSGRNGSSGLGDASREGSIPAESGAEASVKAEADAAADATAGDAVMKAEGQVKKEEGQDGATAMEVDGMQGDSWLCMQLNPVVSFRASTRLVSCVLATNEEVVEVNMMSEGVHTHEAGMRQHHPSTDASACKGSVIHMLVWLVLLWSGSCYSTINPSETLNHASST